MNKFRVNLHSAFFAPESLEGRRLDQVETNTRRDLEALKSPILDEFKESTNKFLMEINDNQEQKILSRYTDVSELRSDQRRFVQRINSQKDGKKYSEVWNENITQGFGRLISSLSENNYFDGKDMSTEIAKIKEQYWEEVKDQYINNVWFAGDKKFNQVKDNLFGDQSPDYPANKIYKKLTGASSIFKVDRQYTEGYNPIILEQRHVSGVDQEDERESMSDREGRNFVSNDLPMYLWNVKKSAPSWLEKIPLISAKIDKPSKEDRKAINKFIKASSRLEGNGNKDKAVALMEVLHDNSLNTDSSLDTYRAVLARHGLNVKDKYLDDIMRVGSFYIQTQSADNSLRDQHAIYLSVLSIIESEGGVTNTVNKFKSIVEQAKKDKKAERKEGYESGENLAPELHELVSKLGITDFTSATRLLNKNPDYFEKTSIEHILANINNDNIIDARDFIVGGSKTGNQFLEIFNQVGEEKALSNLSKHAKLLNKSLEIGLPDAIFDNLNNFKAEIKNGHPGLILLLQNIISNPGEDLYTLLSGHAENVFDGIDVKAERESADRAAQNMINKIDMQNLRSLGLQTPENMHAGLSGALFEAYQMGIGVGGKISFDQWVQGLSLNTGVQYRDDGTIVVGLGIDYSKKFGLGRGRSSTTDVSGGVFVPLCEGKPTLSTGLNETVAKEWVTKNGVQAKLGLQGGVTVMPGAVVVSGGLVFESDKNAGIEYREQEMRREMQGQLKTTLDKINDRLGDKKFDFNDSEVIRIVKGELESMARRVGVKSEEVDKVVKTTLRLLLNYNNYDLNNDDVRGIISHRVAGQYAMSWAEARRTKIADKAYLASANLGAFWVVGTQCVGIYAGMTVKKHDVDGYGDEWGGNQSIDLQQQTEWNQQSLDNLNQQLGLSDNEKLKIEGNFVVIPQSFVYRVRVNPKMKGLMKKSGENVLLSKQTPIAIDVRRGAATQGSEIIIGGKTLEQGQSFQKLDTLGVDWFTNGEINQNEVLQLGEGLRAYTAEVVNRALTDLKSKFPAGDKIHNFNFDMDDILQKLNALDKNKKGKITIVEQNGNLVPQVSEGDTGRGLEVEYQARAEIIDSDAKHVADAVYAEALKLKNPTILNAVKHKPRPEYVAFNQAMEEARVSGDYSGVKDKVLPIFERLDRDIRDENIKFSEVLSSREFQNLQGDALAQAMMAINNIFARSKQVRGGNGQYEFKRPNGTPKEMRAIIGERYKILNTLDSKVNDDQAKGRYRQLFDATKNYVNNPASGYAIRSAKAASLGNTVGFNLGDKTNPENPLFNPEIYDPMVDLDKLDKNKFPQEAREGLHKRAMELFAKNPALIRPVLQAASIDTSGLNLSNLVKPENVKINGNKCELELDIGGKKYTLSAGMKFGFFTQCVNHTIILDDICVTNQDGSSVAFNSGVWEGGNYREGNKKTIVSTTEIGANLSFTMNGEERSDDNSEVKTDDATEGGKSPKTGPSGTTENPQSSTPAGTGTDDIGGGTEV